MRYRHVRDMLDEVREFHGQLSDYYHKLSDSTEQRRVKLMLDHMSDHQRNLQDRLALTKKMPRSK